MAYFGDSPYLLVPGVPSMQQKINVTKPATVAMIESAIKMGDDNAAIMSWGFCVAMNSCQH